MTNEYEQARSSHFGKKHGISSSTEALQRGTGEGHKAGPEVKKALKEYKSHRRVSELES